jgi:predicted nucleic acid-binding protein
MGGVSEVEESTSVSQAGGRSVVTDTGPLLSFGHIPKGIRLFRDRYYGRIYWTEAVSGELANHSRRRNPVGDAARKWDARAKRFLGEPTQLSDQQAVQAMRVRVQAASRHHDPSTASASADQGESEVLVLAHQDGHAMLCNEDAATIVARMLGVDSFCAADILASDVRDGRISRHDAYTSVRGMVSAGIDPGKQVRGPLDFTRWRTYAP